MLLKDNHLGALVDHRGRGSGPGCAGRAGPSRSSATASSRSEEAVEAGADLVLLDNMTPAEVRGLRRPSGAGTTALLVEVSGGVDLETIAELRRRRADFVSVGALTHCAPVLDIGLDLVLDVEAGPNRRVRATS